MDFDTFARLNGVLIGRLDTGRIIRCGTTEHPKSKSGAYFLDDCGTRGWVQAWDQGEDLVWWEDDSRKEASAEDRAKWAKQKADREASQVALWGATSKKALEVRKQCKLSEHNYLHRKGLGDQKGLVTPDGDLFISMHDSKKYERLVGYQTVHWDQDEMVWVKKMQYGTRAKGAVHRIGSDRNTEIVLCEGYATGMSISRALGSLRLNATVLVCFNDTNMVNIAKQIKPGIRAYVFADNDTSGAGQRAGEASGLPWCMSPVVGEDANDLHVRAGLVEVGDLIMNARKMKDAA